MQSVKVTLRAAIAGVAISALLTTSVFASPATQLDPAREKRIAEIPDNDPFEGLNRAIFKFNTVFDGLILRPITMIYRGIVPERGQTMVSHALDNLYTPVTFANAVLQGDVHNSINTLGKFVINSTAGIGGLFEVASSLGVKNHTTDFGKTLAIYGVEPGPYVVIPVIGPCDSRDSIGRLADAFMNPFNYINNETSAAIWSATAIDQRSRHMDLINGIYDSSLDPYTTFRSIYSQKRAAEIRQARELNKGLEKDDNQ